jgi:hypothetical protein
VARPVESRHAQGAGAVYSVAEAVRLLPVRNEAARAWLERERLVHDEPGLGRVVVWREVLDRLQHGRPDDERRPMGAILPRIPLVPR